MRKSASRWWDFPSAVLIVFAILVSSWRLTITGWTPHLGYVSTLAFAGTIVGIALGKSSFGKVGVRLLALGYTLVMISWRLIGFFEDDIELSERLVSLGGRILFSLSQFAANRPVRDELFLVFLLSTAYWFIGLSAGYMLIRHANYLGAILPAAAAMWIAHHFDPSFPNRIWFIAVYFMLALGLLGRQQFLRRRVEWTKNNIHVAPETGQDLSTAALIAAGALVLVAWIIPPRASPPLADLWEEATEPWRNTQERMGQAFASVESEFGRGDYYGESLNLGTRANLNERVAFTVYSPPESLALPRLYWRGRVYDYYESGKWSVSETRLTDTFSPQRDEFSNPKDERRKVYDFTFKSFLHGQSTLYLPGQPVWVSRPVDAELFRLPDEGQDVLVLLAYPYIESGEAYHTRSSIANPSITELREAGEEYPEWVTEHYLQVPEDFPESIVTLAEEIAAGKLTPYDKADAITNELRARIEYTTSVQPPKDGSDVMEWFLFEGKAGYCNYSATAEVLMLRSLGIPARLAVGFSQGENEDDRLVYIVRDQNAHAWPEVYFPGYGWVEFEPTGNQEPLIRPERPVGSGPDEEVGPEIGDNAAEDEPVPSEGPIEEGGIGLEGAAAVNYFLILGVTLAVALFAAGLLLLNRRVHVVERAAGYFMTAAEKRGIQMPEWIRNTALFVLLDPIARSFNSINVSLRWLGKSPALHYTPADRAAALIQLLPEATEEIEALQREHQASLYSPRIGNLAIARRASHSILWKALRAVFRQAWG